MKKWTFALTTFIVIATLNSCDNTTTATNDEKEMALQPNDSLFHINQGGYDFKIILPKDLMIENAPKIEMNNATGELDIHIGDQFWIIASLEKQEIAKIKAELNEDMLFTSRIVEENDKSILYQRILPDGAEYDFSYKYTGEIDGKPYFFRTSEEGEFKMDHVTKMKQAINTVCSAV